jgi:oligopeptide transport system ATP-binding protein
MIRKGGKKMTENMLKVKDLKVSFFTTDGEVEAVRGVSFHLEKGEILGIVGESGSGKSVTSLSILRLLKSTGKIKAGEIEYKGEDILKKSSNEMLKVRGNEIAMIFQDPMTSLNPVFTVGYQISEVIRRHQRVGKAEAKKRAIEILKLVEIPAPEERYDNYPHEFSGGMRQRAMIAMAICCKPDLLIADEPTTALDVTIQAQILKLMKDLKEKINTSIILITHDLGVVANTCSRVLVMYGGIIMEEASVDDIFYNPHNPYTKGLLLSLPKIEEGEKKKLIPIEGSPPDTLNPPKGCPFYDRCLYKMNICKVKIPPNFKIEEDHYSRCWLADEDINSNYEI